ncbi:MAG: GTPase HflX [Candidatus Gracilibacteria bacterium]
MQELKAILIDCIPPDMSKEDAAFRLSEAESLVSTYGGLVILKSIQRKLIPNYQTYIGTGKLDELMYEGKALGANILIINNEMKPQQIWNVSEVLRKGESEMQVWDRIDLILKIFQKHASTKEAQLEIRLASLKHMGPRIFRMGMELSQQGGVGTSRGQGETNTEVMKRHLKEQERKVMQDLEECKRHRELQMNARKRKGLQTVGIIGYTNAGKSSLINTLTKKGAYVADKLFATLDTRVGKIYFQGSGKEILVSDTIGFIQDLPTTLINSFRSTLEETIHADFLLHVLDCSDPKIVEKMAVVHDVLGQIEIFDKPMLYVFNKIDLISAERRQELEDEFADLNPIFISTYSKDGIEELKKKIEERL